MVYLYSHLEIEFGGCLAHEKHSFTHGYRVGCYRYA